MNIIIKDTKCGKIKGLDMGNGIQEFRGIRYATAERWKYPIPVKHWKDIYDATEFGAACPQRRTFDDETLKEPKPFFYHEFREGMNFDYNEDCLFLNIIAPENIEHAPVILYIHGGAFMGGCGNERHMDGTEYAKRGCVFVSINYRLNVFGYLCDSQLQKESGHTGNYGLYDQFEAIRWVYDNIGDYGGDNKHILLFGQSAGAMSIQQLVLTKEISSMVCGAYMASGAGIGKEFAETGTVGDSIEYWERLTALLGKNPEEWRNKSTEEVFDAFTRIADREIMKHCCPHIDGYMIEKEPQKILDEGEQADIPYLLSTNSEDMVPEVLHDMSMNWCNEVNKQKKNPAYYFRFTRQVPGGEEGAFHSSELWYTIGALEKSWRPMEEIDYKLSDILISCIINFARTGTPNCNGAPEWKPYCCEDEEIMVFGDQGVFYQSRKSL